MPARSGAATPSPGAAYGRCSSSETRAVDPGRVARAGRQSSTPVPSRSATPAARALGSKGPSPAPRTATATTSMGLARSRRSPAVAFVVPSGMSTAQSNVGSAGKCRANTHWGFWKTAWAGPWHAVAGCSHSPELAVVSPAKECPAAWKMWRPSSSPGAGGLERYDRKAWPFRKRTRSARVPRAGAGGAGRASRPEVLGLSGGSRRGDGARIASLRCCVASGGEPGTAGGPPASASLRALTSLSSRSIMPRASARATMVSFPSSRYGLQRAGLSGLQRAGSARLRTWRIQRNLLERFVELQFPHGPPDGLAGPFHVHHDPAVPIIQIWLSNWSDAGPRARWYEMRDISRARGLQDWATKGN